MDFVKGERVAPFEGIVEGAPQPFHENREEFLVERDEAVEIHLMDQAPNRLAKARPGLRAPFYRDRGTRHSLRHHSPSFFY